MKEADYQREIQRAIKQAYGYSIKMYVSDFDVIGTPDIIACIDGRMIVVEAKAGSQVTLKQAHELAKWRDAGAYAIVAEASKHPPYMVARFFSERQFMYVRQNNQQRVFDEYCSKE